MTKNRPAPNDFSLMVREYWTGVVQLFVTCIT